MPNNTYPAEFIHDNLAIQTHIIHASYENKVKRLLFLGSSCIYPKHCPPPMKEEYLLTGLLEPTDASRLKNLGWQAKISLEDGILETYNWFVKKQAWRMIKDVS